MEVIKFLQSLSNPTLDKLFIGVTLLGEELFYIGVLCIVFWCLNKKLAYKMTFALLFSVTLNSSLKELFDVARPIGVDGIKSLRTSTATGKSFPSGHTQGASTFWTSLMLYFKKKWLYVIASIIIILVGVSRLYLGVHWPSDVIGGAILGVLCVVLTYHFFDDKRTVLLLISLILTVIGLFFFKSSNYLKTSALFIGFILAALLEDKYVSFDPISGLGKQVLVVLLGIIGIVIVKIGLKLVLPSNTICDFIRYFMLSFFGIFIYPFIFDKFMKHYERKISV